MISIPLKWEWQKMGWEVQLGIAGSWKSQKESPNSTILLHPKLLLHLGIAIVYMTESYAAEQKRKQKRKQPLNLRNCANQGRENRRVRKGAKEVDGMAISPRSHRTWHIRQPSASSLQSKDLCKTMARDMSKICFSTETKDVYPVFLLKIVWDLCREAHHGRN